MNAQDLHTGEMTTSYVSENVLVHYPDTKVKPQSTYTYIATCGSAHTLVACNQNGEPVGWVTATSLGYANVREWLAHQLSSTK